MDSLRNNFIDHHQNELGYFSLLPYEMIERIFLCAIKEVGINFKSLFCLTRVCKRFHQIIYGDSFTKIFSTESDLQQVLIYKVVCIALKILKSFPTIDPSIQNNMMIRWACLNGQTEIVGLLLKDERVDPSARDNMAIRWACLNGQTEIVRLLLEDKRVDPSAQNNKAIYWASSNGHTEIVRLLLEDKRVDPSAQNNMAICWAYLKGHIEIVRVLLKDERIDDFTLTQYEDQVIGQNNSKKNENFRPFKKQRQ